MITHLAFDMDGVIFSSENFIGDAYREAITNAKLHLHIPSSDEIIQQVGRPITLIFQNLFPDITGEEIAILHKETLISIVRMIYDGRGFVFDGMVDVIKKLSSSYKLYICSNGRRKYAESILDKYGLSRYFNTVLSLEDLMLKTKGELLSFYIDDNDTKPENWLMIGDRKADLDAARFAGTKFFGCTWGHGSIDEIKSADHIINEPKELLIYTNLS